MDPEIRGTPSDEELAYVAEHLPELRGRVAGDEIRFSFLILWSLVGLVANVVGFLWSTGVTDTLSALLADLLRTLGTALWTGAVVVVLIQFVPEYLKRSAVRQLDAYAAMIERRKGSGKR